MPLGNIAILYYEGWTIEKAYNNSKSNLKEKKAWFSSVKSLNNQMRLSAMTYNLMRVCEEISKTQNPGLICSIERTLEYQGFYRTFEQNGMQ